MYKLHKRCVYHKAVYFGNIKMFIIINIRFNLFDTPKISKYTAFLPFYPQLDPQSSLLYPTTCPANNIVKFIAFHEAIH